MKFTGERVVPNDMKDRPDIYSEHLIRYAIAMNYCGNMEILDVACGTGYGTKILDSVGKAWGGDNNPESIQYAQEIYGLENIEIIDLETQTILSVFNKKFDVIVSFETIEHLENPKYFLKNVREALAEDGLFIFSAPVQNRSPFHKHIYNYRQATEIGNGDFQNIRIFVQRADMLLPEIMAAGDFNTRGTYIIKVMS
jgi:2-polyprenyl-3-methyl-5-hydroxy-6-metoxy-1,4-benzoquinol methylase